MTNTHEQAPSAKAKATTGTGNATPRPPTLQKSTSSRSVKAVRVVQADSAVPTTASTARAVPLERARDITGTGRVRPKLLLSKSRSGS